MERIAFKPAGLEDLPAVLDVTERAYKAPYKKGGPVTRSHEPEDVKKRFSEREFFSVIAQFGDKTIGSARYRFTPENDVYLFKLAVLEEFRNQGVGPGLVAEVEKIGREKGCVRIILDCMQEKGLPEYYEKLGFAVDRIEPHHDHHDVYMFKAL